MWVVQKYMIVVRVLLVKLKGGNMKRTTIFLIGILALSIILTGCSKSNKIDCSQPYSEQYVECDTTCHEVSAVQGNYCQDSTGIYTDSPMSNPAIMYQCIRGVCNKYILSN